MGKVLFISNTLSHISAFHVPYLRWFKQNHYEVHVLSNANGQTADFCDKLYDINITRNPLSWHNLAAMFKISQVVDKEKYNIVHCHTPVAAMCTRLACIPFRKKGLKVIYTAHGFHFYKGAPLKNWLLYYPVEKICSYFTDVLITINQEDYALAKRKMKAKRIEYVPGVGLDTQKFANTVVDRAEKRKELGIPADAILLMSVGELNENKNHQVVIRALTQIGNENMHYLIAGQGYLLNFLKNLATELGVADRVHFLGYRRDIAELYKTADICVFPSIREGLGLAALEGMATGLPLIASDNRGSRDYTKNGENGVLCQFDSVTDFANAITLLVNDVDSRMDMGGKNAEIVKHFDAVYINKQMTEIYEKEMEEKSICSR